MGTDSHAEFSNNFGLITPRGVRKAGWRAFELLHTHAGSQRITVNNTNETAIYAMATSNMTSNDASLVDNSLRVFLSFWAAPNENSSSEFSSISPAPPPPCPGFAALDGDCANHNNLKILVDESLLTCGAECNTTSGCYGFSFQFGPGKHEPHENCILKNSNCSGHGTPSGDNFVFYERMSGPPPAPAPPPPPPRPASPRTATVTINGGLAGKTCSEIRIDESNANAHRAYVRMGSPKYPTQAQLAQLHTASEVRAKPCSMRTHASSVNALVEIAMQPDSAVVLVFGEDAVRDVTHSSIAV